MPKSAKKRLRSKGNHANSQFAQCNYIKLYELRIIMLLDETGTWPASRVLYFIVNTTIKYIPTFKAWIQYQKF